MEGKKAALTSAVHIIIERRQKGHFKTFALCFPRRQMYEKLDVRTPTNPAAPLNLLLQMFRANV